MTFKITGAHLNDYPPLYPYSTVQFIKCNIDRIDICMKNEVNVINIKLTAHVQCDSWLIWPSRPNAAC